MYKEIFDKCYENMYNRWIIHKLVGKSEGIDFLYSLGESDKIEESYKRFVDYFSNITGKEVYRMEFDKSFKKEVVYDFLEYVFDKYDIVGKFETQKELYIPCFINAILFSFVSEYFMVRENKTYILLDKIGDYEDKINKLNDCWLENRDIASDFTTDYFTTYAYNLNNYFFTDNLLLVYFITKIGYKEGFNHLNTVFDTMNSENIRSKYGKRVKNLKELCRYCENLHDKNTEYPNGYCKDIFNNVEREYRKKKFNNWSFFYQAFDVLAAIECDLMYVEDSISTFDAGYSTLYHPSKFGKKAYDFIEYARNKRIKEQFE